MKPSRTTLIVALALVSAGALAQSSNNVPGATDYAAFSRFVAQRNIFDPNRQPRQSAPRTQRAPRTHTPRVSASAPAFTLVGTMAYEKGWFAFFSGNSDELRQVLSASGAIAGYTVAEIYRGSVVLESGDKAERLELKVGDGMRQENGKWGLSGHGEAAAGSSPAESAPAAPADNSSGGGSGNSAAGPSPAASEPNEVLRKLMEKRAKENQ